MIGGLLLDPVAPLLVVGGAATMAAVRSTGADCVRAVASLGPAFRARPDADTRAARVAVNRIAERAAASGIATADRTPVVERFLARAAAELADARDEAAFVAWGEGDIEERQARHACVHAVWRAAADAAPAMGMIGTVIGLIGMFARMDDPAAIGPGMALALMTTLYGMVVANVIAGPVAARLERLSAIEIEWQRKAVSRLALTARGELTGPLADRVTRIEARLRAAA